jgi:Bacterial Ig-like domain (group 3)
VNAQGVATLMTTAIDAGNRSITASFGGTANLAASASPMVPITVEGDATSIALFALPSSPTYSQNIAVKVTVSSAPAMPTGTVTLYTSFSIAPYATATLNEQGVATFVVPPRLDVAGYLFSAVYSTQSRFAASKSPNLTVNYQPYATTTILSVVSPPVVAGKSFTVAISVRCLDGKLAAGAPSGYLDVFDGAHYLGHISLLNQYGDATFTVAALSFGPHVLSAAYTKGEPTYTSSTSQPLLVNADVFLQLGRATRPSRGGANMAPISPDFATTIPSAAKPDSSTAEGQFRTPIFFYIPLTTPGGSTSSDKPRSDRPRSKRKVRRSPAHRVRPVPSTRSF